MLVVCIFDMMECEWHFIFLPQTQHLQFDHEKNTRISTEELSTKHLTSVPQTVKVMNK
jgi:hypothetical protein